MPKESPQSKPPARALPPESGSPRLLLETGGPKSTPPPPGFRGTRLQFLGALAGGLAHEIKNPLSTIALNLGLLREDWQNPTNAKEQRTLKKIELLEKEARRLGAIVEEFLSFARGEDYKFELLDLNEILREVLELLEAENRQANVRVFADFQANLPRLSLDRDHMKQAVLNFATNARQAMPNGGELLLRTRLEGDSVALEIADTGIGMSPEVRERCFELFFSTRKGGTGYGLAVSKRILEEHGAQVDVWSEVGRGTRFTIRLPLPEAPRTEPRAADTGASPGPTTSGDRTPK